MKRTIALVLGLLMMGCCVACQPDNSTDGTTTTTDATTTATTDVATTTAGDATTTSDNVTSTLDNATTTSEIASTTTTTKKTGTTTTKNENKAVTQMKYNPKIKGLPGTNSKELMANPERGYYMEVNMNVATGKTVAGDRDGIEYLHSAIALYAEETPQLTQNYFYLTDYSDRDLDAEAFETLQRYFDELRKLGIQSCVRFAYEYDESNNVVGPTTQQMLRHMKQLKVFLEKNKDVIHVVQAGFIGLWGEWHHSVHDHDRRTVLEGIVDMTPEDKFVQVRLAAYKDVLNKDDPRRERVSYHDDYLVGEDHIWSSALPSNAPQYNMMLTDCVSMLVAGEMPWGSDKYHNNGVIDGLGMAKHLQKFHYTALSITHNYIESGLFSDYNMAKWKKVPVDKTVLDENGLRYEENWLLDENGQPTTRSLFAYIRDHLGYYLTASDVTATVNGKSITTKLSLKNYGFSAPHGMDTIQLVLLDKNGKIVAKSDSLCTMDALQPGITKTVEATLSASALYAGYQVGIRFANDRGLTARLASDIPYENGINILFTLN